MPLLQSDYKAPRWLPGAHLQTIVPARFFPRPDVQYRREIVDMPDGDFIVLDWSEPEPMELNAPVLVHFHGLEGDSHSHYAEALMHECVKCGWRGVVAHFRGCGGLPNRLPRAYFAGDSDDCDWILRTVHERFITAPIYAVGVSLGGNYIAKYMGERPQEASFLTAAVSIGAPVDLVAGSEIMSRGANKLYEEMFLSTQIGRKSSLTRPSVSRISLTSTRSRAAKRSTTLTVSTRRRFITSRARWSIGPCARPSAISKTSLDRCCF